MRQKKTAAAAADGDGGGAPEAAEASPAPVSPRKRAKRSPAAAAAEGGATKSPSPAAAGKKAAVAAEAATAPSPLRRSPRATAGKKRTASPEPAAAAAAAAPAPAKASPPKAAAKAKPAAGPKWSTAMRAPRLDAPALSVMAWNVAGLRSLLKKDAGAVRRLVEQERVDVLCLQETKLQESHVADALAGLGLPGWAATFSCSAEKKGYSGVATLCRQKPLSVVCGIGDAAHDGEGRVITVETPEAYVVNAYVPNSGEGLKRLDYRTGEWDVAFADYIKSLEAKGKPVVVAGDLNCAHKEIDIHNPKGNLKSAGFTPEERASFSQRLVGDDGPLVDSFRALHPGVVGYTYYSYRFNARASGRGWRLDYCLVSKALAPRVHDAYILDETTGSDHVPLGVVIRKA